MRIAGIPIEDPAVEATVSSDGECMILRFDFRDANDPSLRAKVSVAVEPAEAVDLIDKMIAELIRLGVKLEVTDRITEIVEVKARA